MSIILYFTKPSWKCDLTYEINNSHLDRWPVTLATFRGAYIIIFLCTYADIYMTDASIVIKYNNKFNYEDNLLQY